VSCSMALLRKSKESFQRLHEFVFALQSLSLASSGAPLRPSREEEVIRLGKVLYLGTEVRHVELPMSARSRICLRIASAAQQLPRIALEHAP